MEILAAPITFSLNLFITKPPVIIPKATAGRFIMPAVWKRRKYVSNELTAHMELIKNKTYKTLVISVNS